jgi:hypothetical protein
VFSLQIKESVSVLVWSFVRGDMRVRGFVSGDMLGGFGPSSLLISHSARIALARGRTLRGSVAIWRSRTRLFFYGLGPDSLV